MRRRPTIEHLRAGARIQTELAPPRSLPRHHRGWRRARVPASTWWRAVRRFGPRRAAAGGKLLQLVHLRRVVRRVRRAGVHRVGGEQQGMGPFGFGLCALFVLLGMLVWIAGFPLYRNQLPSGSPITRILQVLVVAFKNRNLRLPDDTSAVKQKQPDEAGGALEVLRRTKEFKCLDKAAVDTGRTGAWSLCSVTQVEETKIILGMVPIFLSAVLGYIPVPLILNFTVQQGNTMDTKLGAIHISPATLFVIPTVFQMAILIVYDRFIVPFLRKITGYVGGVTHLQRIGIGFLSAAVATGVAALLETKRKKVAEEADLMDAATGIPMSVFWLTIQFFLLGVVDVTSFVGLLEFFYSETSMGMKSIGSSIFYCILGVSAWLGSLLIQLVNQVTRRGGRTVGWLDGTNLNKGKLDRFYWLLAVLELVALMIYMFFARRYVYRNDQRVVVEGETKNTPNGTEDLI